MVTLTEAPLADKVDTLRKQRGVSLTDLAESSGMPRTTLAVKIRNGDKLELGQLRAISTALGVTLAFWLSA